MSDSQHPTIVSSLQLCRRSLAPFARGPKALGLLLVLASLLLPLTSLGVERFPPPELDPKTYTMPPTTTPPARAYAMELVDVAVLLAALSLASYFVLKKRSRRHVFWLMIFSLLYFGFYRKGCICPIGSIQDVTLALFSRGYAVPLSVIAFFLLPLVFTLFFGRTFCAAVCPLGAAQDVVLWRPVKLRPWLEHALGLIPYIYLGAAVLFAATGSAFVICEWDPFVSFFRRGGSFQMLAIGAGFLAVGLFIGRPYCRFFCPYGAVLSVLSRFSKWNVTRTPDECIKCMICDVAGPFGAIAEPAEGVTAPASSMLPVGRAVPSAPPGGRASPRAQALTPDPCLLPPASSPSSRGLVVALAIVALVLVFGGAWLGGRLAVPMSKMNYAVRLAERIAAEDAGQFQEPDNASKAFRGTGKPTSELYAEALRVRGQFGTGGLLLGAFVGLVVGLKLISLRQPELHTVYEPDRATCLGCGRCYSYCPKELVRVKRAEKKREVVPT